MTADNVLKHVHRLVKILLTFNQLQDVSSSHFAVLPPLYSSASNITHHVYNHSEGTCDYRLPLQFRCSSGLVSFFFFSFQARQAPQFVALAPSAVRFTTDFTGALASSMIRGGSLVHLHKYCTQVHFSGTCTLLELHCISCKCYFYSATIHRVLFYFLLHFITSDSFSYFAHADA